MQMQGGNVVNASISRVPQCPFFGCWGTRLFNVSIYREAMIAMEIRIRKKLHFALILLLSVVISSDAHLGGRVFPIPYLTDEMVDSIQIDDGLVDEWTELVGEPTMTLLDFVEEWWGNPFDPSSLDFQIWLAWHDDPARVYLAFVGSDDVYKNTQDYSGDWFPSTKDDFVWGLNDCLALAIDADHSGGAGIPKGDSPSEDLLRASGETQYYEAIARAIGGPTLDDVWTRNVTGAFAWTVLPPYGDGGGAVVGEAPIISVIELYVTPFDRMGDAWDSPEGSVISTLRADRIIGFSVGVVDNDLLRTDGARPNFWIPEAIFSGGYSDVGFDEVHSNMWNRVANTFLDGLLLPEGKTAPVEDTAVESVSWGRIKASLW